jgi:hypothetical protein
MKNLIAGYFLLFFCVTVNAQSNYNPAELFAPSTYPYGTNLLRNGAGEPGPDYWQNKADYKINASLGESKNEIRGSVLITYYNNSPQAISNIWLMLEQNLFNNNSRGFAKLPANGRSRYGNSKSEFKGGYKIEGIKVLDEAGKENNADTVINDTRMQLRLGKPVASKSKLQVKIDFSFIVPEYGADRMGYLNTQKGKIYAMAQWYPRVCVFDDIRGWNADPYLGPSEFYLEYGDFEVSITVPSDHVVVASGELLNPQEVLTADQLKRYNEAKGSDKTVVIKPVTEVGNPAAVVKKPSLTWKYKIANARDFAWASSKSFIWDGSKINLPSGKTAFAQSVYPQESAGATAWTRSTEYVKTSIENYSKRWYEFPYPSAVNVASNISGMEYPGIVFCGWKDTGEDLWGVTDHEFGHTWFPMIVGSNERRYGWMDEGFNTFINQISSEDFNKGEFQQAPISGVVAGQRMTGDGAEKVMLTPDAMQEKNIGINLYYKPGYALSLLRNQILGQKRFDYAFKKYIRDWAFKHPTPWDFFRSMESSTGEDLYWFWKGLILENYKLDQGIRDVQSADGGVLVSITNNEKMAMPVILELTTESGKLIRKMLPIEIWQHQQSYDVRVPTTEKVRKVVLDPEMVYPDALRENNVWQGLK